MRDWRIVCIAIVLMVFELPEFIHVLDVAWFGQMAGPTQDAQLLRADLSRDVSELLFSSAMLVAVILLVRWLLQQSDAAVTALAANEKRFRDFAESASDWLWETDAKLRFTYMSDNVEKIAGVAPEWHYGKTRQELLGANYDRLVWDRHLGTMKAKEPFRNFVYKRVGEGVETRWLRTSGRPYYDEHGAFKGYRGVGSDVTEEIEMQQTVARTEERFREAIAAMNQGFALFDGTDRLAVWNDRFEEINADIRHAIALGAPIGDIVGAMRDSRGTDPELYDLILSPQREEDLDVVLTFPDDRSIRLEIYDIGDGGRLSLWTDVSELKRAEAAMKNSFDELRLITDNVPVLIVHFDLEQRIRFMNATAKAWHRLDDEHALGGRLKDLLPASSYARIEPHIRRALSGKSVQVSEKIRYADGVERHVDLAYVPEFDSNGRVAGIIAVVIDATERHRLDRAQQQSEKKIANLIAASLQGIWVYDDNGKMLFATEKAAEIFAFDDVDDLTSIASVNQLIAPADLDRLLQYREARLHGDEAPSVYEFEGRTKAGDARWFVAMSMPVDWDGANAVLTSAIDVTDQHKAEEQLRQAQKMEAVGQLTGGIAHDFNNMLTVIQGNADMLLETIEQDSPAASLIGAVTRAAERSAELTQRLLAFSRQQPLTPKSVDVGQLLKGMGSLLSRTLGDDIDIRIDVAPEIDRALVDPGQLENAILNLSINARDAMPGGGALVIRGQTAILEEAIKQDGELIPPGTYVEVSVTDSGTGMPPEVLARAFDPFFTTKEVGRGTGLGLSMVYGFARQSRGFARISTAVGKGTSIRISLPAIGADEAAGVSDVTVVDRHHGEETILLVEDDKDVAHFTRTALRRLGYTILEAHDGPEAMELLETRNDINMLLSDVVLPSGVNGCQVADVARQTCPDIGVLLISGYPRDALTEVRMSDDMNFLPKPYTATKLAECVRATLDHRALEQPAA